MSSSAAAAASVVSSWVGTNLLVESAIDGVDLTIGTTKYRGRDILSMCLSLPTSYDHGAMSRLAAVIGGFIQANHINEDTDAMEYVLNSGSLSNFSTLLMFKIGGISDVTWIHGLKSDGTLAKRATVIFKPNANTPKPPCLVTTDGSDLLRDALPCIVSFHVDVAEAYRTLHDVCEECPTGNFVVLPLHGHGGGNMHAIVDVDDSSFFRLDIMFIGVSCLVFDDARRQFIFVSSKYLSRRTGKTTFYFGFVNGDDAFNDTVAACVAETREELGFEMSGQGQLLPIGTYECTTQGGRAMSRNYAHLYIHTAKKSLVYRREFLDKSEGILDPLALPLSVACYICHQYVQNGGTVNGNDSAFAEFSNAITGEPSKDLAPGDSYGAYNTTMIFLSCITGVIEDGVHNCKIGARGPSGAIVTYASAADSDTAFHVNIDSRSAAIIEKHFTNSFF